MPSQHIPFEWKNEGGHGRKGTWLPYQCVESITPTVVGWEGPGCSPLSAGYASACGCADNTDCAPSEYCQDNRCVNTATGSNSCACDPAGLSAPATCSSGRTCHQGACVKTCAVASDCSASLTCDNGLCVPQWGIPLAEQITWGMSNVQAPMHAVSTYALSDLELSAYLAAGIKIELALKLLGKVKKFTIWEWKDMWDLASTNKTWYQPGLEAQYQAQCSMNAGAVENYQPVKVTRYPDPNINASYDELDELLAWCFPELESHADNPPAPTNDDLTGSINDVLDWGTDIGLDIWSSQQLCINGQLWTDWAQNAQGSLSNLTCEYKDPQTGVTTTFPCTDIMPNLLHAWGCLRTNASTFAGLLASQFPSLVVNVGGQPTFNWTAMLIDPTGELSLSNLLPSIRFFSKMFVSSIGEKWLAKVEQCFDARYDVESLCHCQAASDCNPGETCQGGLCKDSNGDATQCPIVTISVSQVGPCCGDGVVLPTEECDDGNTVDGDGCSSTCKKQDVNPRGACCTAKGCTFLPQRECQAAGGEFHVGKTCAQINECRPAITGACCGKDGCQSPVEVDACKASGGVAHAGKSCHEINYCAPGEEPGDTQGACCIRGICYEGVEIKACELKGGNAYAGRMCSQVECRSVEPTVGACCLDGACTDGVYAEKCQGAGGMLHVNMTCAAVNYCKTARPYSGEYSAR
ncbi:MAG: hypothetical protein HY698_03045 [Deltaproteobacteria bacterium]|nr:hypothetical protein [Deltaproteobacteria bacterium]